MSQDTHASQQEAQDLEKDKHAQRTLPEIVVSDFGPEGAFARLRKGYELRPAQVEMARLVAQAIAENTPAIIEAPTGTGKGYAYLVAIVRSGKRAILSTSNKSLQEQLMQQDIPVVQKAIGEVKVAMMKGVGNYVCLLRAEHERRHSMQYRHRDLERVFQAIDASDASFSGDIDLLGFQIDTEIRERILFERELCTGKHCTYYQDCYLRRMRKAASEAQITVVNHTLLLLDAVLGGSLLPPHDLILLDEAHHLEEEAIATFTITIPSGQIFSLLRHPMLQEHTDTSLQEEAHRALSATWQRLAALDIPEASNKRAFSAPIAEGQQLARVIEQLATSLQDHQPAGLSFQESTAYNRLVGRTHELARKINLVFTANGAIPFVYYVERAISRKGEPSIHALATPLIVAPLLQKHLFEKHLTICTSATIATVDGAAHYTTHPLLAANDPEPVPSFGYFRRTTGFGPRVTGGDCIEHILPQTFSYRENALLYLPAHLPEPRYEDEKGAEKATEAYLQAIASEMAHLVQASKGRAFLLFSSKRQLEMVYELLSQMPAISPFPLLHQGGKLTRKEMLRVFREKPSVLLGLKSFWEGIDVTGDALSLVVIDKLPFQFPGDPVMEARERTAKASGENWFGMHVIPQVTLRLKQGLGRLIRTSSERGVMAILDTRLHNRSYARTILSALPPARTTTRFLDVEQFFESLHATENLTTLRTRS